MRKREAVTPPNVVASLIDAARGTEIVLVGGQALAYWADYYKLLTDLPPLRAISNDVDFLARSPADRESVALFAKALGGKTVYTSWRALTALVGQAVRDVSAEEYLNVDVIFKVLGLESEMVRSQAVPAGNDDAAALIMHPLDVLYSRLVNVHQLPEKNNDKGRFQLQLAIDVGREYLRDLADREPDKVRSTIRTIARWARDDAGRKVAERHGIHVADAIDPLTVPRTSRYWERGWPWQRQLMSATYQRQVEATILTDRAASFRARTPPPTRSEGDRER
jgi:hypothetical protein